jgi:hypothetical protein
MQLLGEGGGATVVLQVEGGVSKMLPRGTLREEGGASRIDPLEGGRARRVDRLGEGGGAWTIDSKSYWLRGAAGVRGSHRFSPRSPSLPALLCPLPHPPEHAF